MPLAARIGACRRTAGVAAGVPLARIAAWGHIMRTVDPRFPSRLRQLRHERGWSLQALAERSYLVKSTISALETGARRPTAATAAALDTALDAGGELAAMVTEDAPAAEARMWGTAELLDRIRACDMAPGTIDALHVTVGELCCAYSWRDAHELRGEGLRWLRETLRLLGRPTSLRAHQELLTAAGWLALLVGCIEYDLGLRPAAEATRVAARELGHEGGNTEIEAWAWEMAAWMALTQGRWRDTLDAAETGQAIVGQHTAAVQLIGQQAKALARLGDQAGVREALDRGRRLLDRFAAPSRPDHHFVVDPDKWDFYAMDAYRLVGMDTEAAHHAEQVLILGTAPDGSEKAPMRMAEARLTLGAVAARQGELEQAVEVGVSALAASRRSLPSLLMVAGEVDRELTRRDPGGPLVAEFRAAVHQVSTD